MKRQIVYVAGAYRSKWGLPGKIVNIWKAYRTGRKLVRQGYCTYIPHMNTALMDIGLQDDQFFLDCGIKMLPKCQIIYMMKGFEYSDGACAELKEAQRRGLTVWYEDKPVEIVAMYDPCEYKLEPITSLDLQEAGVIK